jgi:two-component system sensor histidine kinase UhpB
VSLRLRLTLVLVILFLLALLVITVRSISVARQDMREEIEFSRQIASQFIDLMPVLDDPAEQQAAINRLYSQLTRMQTADRYAIDFTARANDVGYAASSGTGRLRSPTWFPGMLGIDESRLILQHVIPGGQTLVIRIDPVGRINDFWAELSHTMTTRLGSLVTIAMILYLLVGYWLRPIGGIIAALEQLVKGDYSRRIAPINLAEINEVAEKINQLASVLGSSKTENERLTRQAMSVQEQERRFLAQELHDSLGQAVSAIKAMAVSIANRTRETQPVIAESASNIEKISDDAYKSVRNLMAWLRPAVLDELGLMLALQQMVDDWNVHHEDTFCSLRMDTDLGELKEQQQIQVYRIVQEALTNVAKHAEASRVSIVFSGQEIITLIISDDGKGFDGARVRMGIGLSNLRDRSNLLRGSFNVSSKRGKGTTLHIEFPRGQQFRRKQND